jgi:DNA ligase-1
VFPDGVDGELIVNGIPFNKISSAISSFKGEPDFTYYVFDWLVDLKETYEQRVLRLGELIHLKYCAPVIPTLIENEDALLSYEEHVLDHGYEGICFRTPDSPYKFGRSTLNQGWLIKFKRFADSEAEIISLEEQKRNENELERDELGYAKRSKAKAGMIDANTLGSFLVRDIYNGKEFGIGGGTGVTQELRKEIWNNKDKYIGRIIKYKYQPVGVKELPRFPTFIGFRDEDDMD